MMHKSVLLEESIEGLNLKEGIIAVDATLGGGGHSEKILEKIGEKGKLIVIDLDESAIKSFEKKHSKDIKKKRIYLFHDNFANLKEVLKKSGVGKVDAILADIGFSSIQMDDASRGMSFQKDSRLDMRLDKDSKITAKKVVNEYSRDYLENIFKVYGEEKFARNIAKRIIEARNAKEIETTGELARIIEGAIPKRFQNKKIHPATKVFQAIRIEVNQELENLKKFIPQAIESLNHNGRLAIISFHSLEDRIVKNIFLENARGCICPKNFPQCRCGNKPKIKIITKKPIISGEIEIKENPRSRSAKLRICEKF